MEVQRRKQLVQKYLKSLQKLQEQAEVFSAELALKKQRQTLKFNEVYEKLQNSIHQGHLTETEAKSFCELASQFGYSESSEADTKQIYMTTNKKHKSSSNAKRKKIQMTVYNNECFTHKAKPTIVEIGEQIFGSTKRGRKKKIVNTANREDTGLIKVPKTASKPSPVQINTDINWRESLKDIDPAVLERYYQYRRIHEFGSEASSILYKRLEPNYSKFGHWLYLGSCPKHFVDILFTHQNCLKWTQSYRAKENGIWTQRFRTVYYFKGSMPDLLVDHDWALKLHPISELFNNKEMRSWYHEAVFIVNDDNRVFLHFSQVTQAFCNYFNKWEDTA
ncbi:hypothetical protein C9374_010083 [Naegleria lovaniensis]|uniref:Uncharacterized protein n=1 Tax=Naegleria lovaniensis TaxID=51637 RepID=A0AA88KG66_NAELO|nr:uncharacterized protein C9374_010083 [Naegleria lovaniensis]KAG2375079.1 hypothetical protein C9374_010083 [Naegleria lovaniensis]